MAVPLVRLLFVLRHVPRHVVRRHVLEMRRESGCCPREAFVPLEDDRPVLLKVVLSPGPQPETPPAAHPNVRGPHYFGKEASSC